MTDLRTAAQQALEALESADVDPHSSDAVYKAIDDLKAALAEPVQEPVAWQWLDTAHFRKKIPVDATPSHWRPLYTAPPQRKPLTDAVLGGIAADIWGSMLIAPQSYKAFARAIERAHGIGGQDE